MQLVTAIARHERRVRLMFDRPLAASVSDPSRFQVARGLHTVPVVGLVLVAGQPHVVELALGHDLVRGTPYEVHADAIAAADGTSTPIGSLVRVALPTAAGTEDDSIEDGVAWLYGLDCVWSGGDYLETAAGDLATAGGEALVRDALARRLSSDGLAWDPSYGARARHYVDGAPGALATLAGTLVRQARADDRVRRASVTYTLAETEAQFEVSAELRHGGNVAVPLRVRGG